MNQEEFIAKFTEYAMAHGIPKPEVVADGSTVTGEYVKSPFLLFNRVGAKIYLRVEYLMLYQDTGTLRAEIEQLRRHYGMSDAGVMTWQDFIKPKVPEPGKIGMVGARIPQAQVQVMAMAFGIDPNKEYYQVSGNVPDEVSVTENGSTYFSIALGPFTRWFVKVK